LEGFAHYSFVGFDLEVSDAHFAVDVDAVA
jgi:hypothetical protein